MDTNLENLHLGTTSWSTGGGSQLDLPPKILYDSQLQIACDSPLKIVYESPLNAIPLQVG